MGKKIEHIPEETLDAFKSYPWPGNIRELQNVIERAVILSDDGVLPNPLPPARTEPITSIPVRTTLRDSERTLILQALEMSGWVIGGPSGAAARLGLETHHLNRQNEEERNLPATHRSLTSYRVVGAGSTSI